ncbi:uncharacterized protein [Physcomitrium patens]|uniref:DUF642 domain-containing protein n=1 Tax=Physcomitrium patens TaxID=3218 RepID=A9RJG6_PHYPA|nr:hypothetical protein PHYPA_006454 [Physcomitrium patens]
MKIRSWRSNVFGMWSLARMLACVLLQWAVLWINVGTFARGLALDLVETETGWNFEDVVDYSSPPIEVFDGNVTTALSAHLPPKHIFVLNSDFELTTVTSNVTVLADTTLPTIIPNWLPGGAGVQILQSASYQMSTFAGGVFAIHLNNPFSAGNSTQGSISTMNLPANPKPATLYTVQYDCARMPDGPLNLVTTLKVSSMTGLTTNYYTIHTSRYNITDTPKQITWTRKSFLFMGTGALTSIRFESMSEKYGPIIDNIVLQQGVHILHDLGPPARMLALWQWLCPIFTAFAFIVVVQPQDVLLFREAAQYLL